MLFFYNVLLILALFVLVPLYGLRMLRTGKYRASLAKRLGNYPSRFFSVASSGPRFWVHAVSVGEVTAAAPIISALRERMPRAVIFLSTATETGQEMARSVVEGADVLFYYPLDFPLTVRKMLGLVQPHVFIPVETEVWPNFFYFCRRFGIPIIMANGRLSLRSYRRYSASRFFWKSIFSQLEGLGAIAEGDARRFAQLGVPEERIAVLGNAKYDGLAAKTSGEIAEEIREILRIPAGSKVFLAGSTHAGEEEAVIGVYLRLLKKYPDCYLIVVPRHVERVKNVLALLDERGIARDTLSEILNQKKGMRRRVLVVDGIGWLFKLYSVATVVFCGGSLVPKGGQNILEAAAWGKVVFYGPFMDDFREESELLERVGAGMKIKDTEELLTGILDLLLNPRKLEIKGKAARAVVEANRGASGRHADFILGRLAAIGDGQGKGNLIRA